jgi:tetratricopeptide (TPR) repeat protein
MQAIVSNTMDSPLEKLHKRLSWLRHDPDNAGLYRECATLALAIKQFDVLLELATQALARNPTDTALLFDRANAEIGRRDYPAALATLAGIEPATEEQRHAIAANQAVCHYCLNEYEQALPLLLGGYQRGQRGADWLFMLVRASHHVGQLDEAVAIAKENAEAGAQSALLAGAYALMFLDAGDAGAAARWSATALRLDPRSIDGAITEGTLALMRLQIERAERHFNTVLEAAPENGRAWLGLGTLAMLQTDLKLATQHFQRALQSMPAYVGGWHMLGWAQLMQRDLVAAEQSLNHALTLDRNFAETHGTLAALDAMKGDIASAKQRLTVAQRLDPRSLSTHFAAALLADPTLKSSQSQHIIQQTLLKMAGEDGSALGKLLIQRPKG